MASLGEALSHLTGELREFLVSLPGEKEDGDAHVREFREKVRHDPEAQGAQRAAQTSGSVGKALAPLAPERLGGQFALVAEDRQVLEVVDERLEPLRFEELLPARFALPSLPSLGVRKAGADPNQHSARVELRCGAEHP
jgi:hypothetical protein